jgi:CRISPR-associated endonuclease Cas2
MSLRHWYLSYDIGDPKRLARLAKLALEHGERVQKSLYLCPLSPDQLERLHVRMAYLVAPTARAMLRPVCRTCRARTRYQGAGGHPERREPFWIV